MTDPTRNADQGATCRHGVPLVYRVGAPSASCEDCTDAFMANPRYYADGLHLPDPTTVTPPGEGREEDR